MQCAKCGEPLKVSTSNANRGKVVSCPKCRQREWYEKNKERVKNESRAYYERTAARRRAISRQNYHALSIAEKKRINRKNALRQKYGITLEQYERMLQEQKGMCFLCGQKPSGARPLSVDHCHREKRVRKLLCELCNRSLGVIERDPSWVDRALQYLKS